ncbi:type II secretion system secretin GspD [Magnetospirillum sp. UT-4]|uniref:type II secretion system secretin GspD n=1 Tax=Magnetospirillum sp. UT-4 TaxID=2681467 RepID=UPI001385BCDF|nr:type II secretion system secretin GspD [Magnetospirillum sp. UT-4]CAA7621450.1 General secretion pathway protein D [Magnetospirillum sp. UT-4]
MRRLLLLALLLPAGCGGHPPPEAPAPPPPAATADSAVTAEPATVLAPPPRPAAPEPILKPGSGRFVRAPAAIAPPVREEGGGEVSVDFADTDIREVVQTVLGDILGAAFVVDPAVKGTLTLRTARPVPKAELARLLGEVLRMNGAALVDGGGVLRVVPLAEAKGRTGIRAMARRRGDAGGGYGLRVMPLDFVSAEEMRRILEPLVPADQVTALGDGRNILLLTGTEAELDNMVETVRIFDVDWLQGMSFGLVPVTAVDADTMVEELERMFGGQTGALAGTVRFVPLKRLGSVMIIASRPNRLAQARDWVEQLDRTGRNEMQRLFVYRVQHGRAGPLARLLGNIFSPEPAVDVVAAVAPAARNVQIVAQRGEMRASSLPEPAPPPAAAAATARELKVTGGGPVRVTADEKTNSLVIYASARDFRLIEEALRELDRVPMQVLIEATIAEVTLTDQLRYGLQWFFQTGVLQNTLSRANSGAVTAEFPGFAALAVNGDIRVVLDALSSVTNVNVVSAPKLVVLDNETARLQVGDQVPVPVQSAVSVTDPGAPIVNTIQFRDTGVILEVTPHVSSAGTVTMEVRQEVSDVVSTSTSGIDAPTIQQRAVATRVAVDTGETVALGGLIRDRARNGRSGIPLLKDIPLLGFLFGATNETVDRTELLVMLTPRIIRSPIEARAVTEELRRRMRAVEGAYGKGQ